MWGTTQINCCVGRDSNTFLENIRGGGGQGSRGQKSVNTTDLPGTARCLRGKALSLEGSEPIQSALALPMPAGRVFMPQSSTSQRRPL